VDLTAALSLAAFGVLAVASLTVLRRWSRLVAETRDLDRFKRGVAEVDRRVGAIIEPLLTRLDEVRFRRAGPELVTDALPSAVEELEQTAVAARTLVPPPGFADVPPAIAREVERAVRALGMVEHGTTALETIRGGHRQLEAETSLKRGALNLRHARDAIGTLQNRVAAVEYPSVARRRRRANAVSTPVAGAGSASRTSVVAAPPMSLTRRNDGPSDPSM